jgi:beta-glucanase (GH16 family)
MRDGALRFLSPAVCAICALTGMAATACADPQAVATSASATWTKVWSADFAGPAGSGIDTRYWKYQTGVGIFGNGEVETMTNSPANVSLDGHGDLAITAFYRGTSWESGRIETTSSDFGAPAGGELQVTASIKLPSPVRGLGYWPAFWMLGPGSWPEHGEIDIMEDVNGLSEHSGALHCGNLTHANSDGTMGPCHEHVGLSSGMQPCSGCLTGFHTYSVIVDRRDPGDGQIRWYLDGRQFFSVSESQLGAATWDSAVDHGFSIILDLAIGGQYPDQQCRCTTPDSYTTSYGAMLVRSLAVYQS